MIDNGISFARIYNVSRERSWVHSVFYPSDRRRRMNIGKEKFMKVAVIRRRCERHWIRCLVRGRPRPPGGSGGIFAEGFSKAFANKVDQIRRKTESAPAPDFSENHCDSIFDSFSEITADDVSRLIGRAKNKTCNLNFVPTWIAKEFSEQLSLFVSLLFNASLRGGTFPSRMKHDVVIPGLKKAAWIRMTWETTDRFPIYNLYPSCWNAVLWTAHWLRENDLMPEKQSAYRRTILRRRLCWMSCRRRVLLPMHFAWPARSQRRFWYHWSWHSHRKAATSLWNYWRRLGLDDSLFDGSNAVSLFQWWIFDNNGGDLWYSTGQRIGSVKFHPVFRRRATGHSDPRILCSWLCRRPSDLRLRVSTSVSRLSKCVEDVND